MMSMLFVINLHFLVDANYTRYTKHSAPSLKKNFVTGNRLFYHYSGNLSPPFNITWLAK